MVSFNPHWLQPATITITPGTRDDYRQLARFHYAKGHPAIISRIFSAHLVRSDHERKLIGVGVLSHPTPSCTAREIALNLSHDRYDPAKIDWLNKNLRTIARIIVHPNFRGASLATDIVRTILRESDTDYVEAFAHMGRCIPFFQRAGMTPHNPSDPSKPHYYLWRRRAPSPGTPGEGRGEGLAPIRSTAQSVGATPASPAPESQTALALRSNRLDLLHLSIPSPKQIPRNIETPDDLHAWIHHHLHLNIPRTCLCPHHNPPFDYLKYSFFEPSKDLVVWAPRGGGKTRLGAIATLLDLIHKPKCSIRILGGSLEQSQKMWDHLRDDAELLKDQFDIAITANQIKMPNGSIASVLSQSQKSVRGLRVQKLRCDEVELFDRRVWQAAQLVTRSRKLEPDEQQPFDTIAGVVEVFSTLHEPFGLMQEIVDQAIARGTRVLRWCLLDVLEPCPDSRLCDACALYPECKGAAKKKTEGFFSIEDALVQKSRVSLDTWQAEMLCLRPSTQRSVFPTFDTARHVRSSVSASRDHELWVGMDFGFCNPFVALWIRRFADGAVHVIDEYVQSGQTLDRHIVELRARARSQHGPIQHIACDPAGSAINEQTALSNVSILRKMQFSVRMKGSPIQTGLELIRTALLTATGQTSLFIHPTCTRLIKAMQCYRYPDHPSELPLKDGQHDHLIDALRYFYINSTTSQKVVSRKY